MKTCTDTTIFCSTAQDIEVEALRDKSTEWPIRINIRGERPSGRSCVLLSRDAAERLADLIEQMFMEISIREAKEKVNDG